MNHVRWWLRKAGGALRRDRQLAAIAASFLGSTVASTGIGVLFWMLAARGLGPASLGTLGAATAAMSFLGVVGTVGLGPLLVSELRLTAAAQRWELFLTASIVAVAAGCLLGAVFGALAASTGGPWVPLAAPGATWWWFSLGTGVTSLSLVLDHAMLIVGNPVHQIWRNVTASLWKAGVLALASVLATVDLTTAMAAWSTGLLLGTVIAEWSAARQLPGRRLIAWHRVKELIRRQALAALGHHGVNVSLSASALAMPAVIAWLLPPEQNAVFTTVRLIATLTFFLPYALAVSLFAATAGDMDFDAARSRRVLLAALLISTVVCGGVFVLARFILMLFGGGYSDAGTLYLRLMVLAAPLLVFKDQFIAQARMRRQIGSVVHLVVLAGLMEVGFALAGAAGWQLRGALLGWLSALALQAAYVAPRLTWRTPRTPSTPNGDEAEDVMTRRARGNLAELAEDVP